MKFISTRDIKGDSYVSSAYAIKQGLAPNGGLYVPESIPVIDEEFVSSLLTMSYPEMAAEILSLYLDDFSKDELLEYSKAAYINNTFPKEVEPLSEVTDQISVLELWHGPTAAFKDFALSIMPRLLTASLRKLGEARTALILVATSGDTGKAALEGYRDVDGVKIKVFYPVDGVSKVQKLQMATQLGSNVDVCAIRGNFDDAQTGVKKIFSDKEIAAELNNEGYFLSSANSINWGRLAPQIVYYFVAYCTLINRGKIKYGEIVDFCVPTGNFGNILATYYAKRMGVPVKTLICASNANNVLTDFLTSGTYDKNRDFYCTTSPSMDILISSNLERLLFHLCDENDVQVAEWMSALNNDGKYTVSADVADKVKALFAAGCCDDTQTKATISKVFDEKNYLCDTHTAVAVKVYDDYVANTGDKTPTVIASTANPYKFSASVLAAITDEIKADNEFDMVDELFNKSNEPVPQQLATLKGKEPRFTGVSKKEEMKQVVFDMLGL